MSLLKERWFQVLRKGCLVLLGIENSDTQDDIQWLAKKIANLRIFNDENNVMNRSLLEEEGGAIVVSQFTLHASTKKGNRPSYIKAAKPPILRFHFMKLLSPSWKK